MKLYVKCNTNNTSTLINSLDDYMQWYDTIWGEGTPQDIEIPDDSVLLSIYQDQSDFLYVVKHNCSPKCFRNIKSRLTQIIPFYSGDFKPPRDLIHKMAHEVAANIDYAPYDIEIVTKPTSVYLYIKLSKREAREIGVEEYKQNILNYASYLETLPHVGAVDCERALSWIKYIDGKSKPYLPIQLFAVNV